MKKSTLVILSLVLAMSLNPLNATISQSAEPIPTPELKDPYFPILKDLKFSIDLSTKLDPNSKIIYPAVAKVDLKVKYHRNSTHAIEIAFNQKVEPGVDWKTCSRFNKLLAPSDSFGIKPPDSSFGSNEIVLVEKIGNRRILETLKKREKVGDWFEESFSFKSSIYSNEFLEPCLQSVTIESVTIHDVAGKKKIVRIRIPEGDFIEIYDTNPILPENKCPKIFIGNAWYQNFPVPCEDNTDFKNTVVQISRKLIENSKATPKSASTPLPAELNKEYSAMYLEVCKIQKDFKALLNGFDYIRNQKYFEINQDQFVSLSRARDCIKSPAVYGPSGPTQSDFDSLVLLLEGDKKLIGLRSAWEKASVGALNFDEKQKPSIKEKSLTCLKGKSSLKVIGKNPKCPAGYKVKK